jgi:hypothetical protein
MTQEKCVCALLVAAVLAGSHVVSAHAKDTKPDISVATKTLEVSISIDPALKKHPGLYDGLLAEAKREVAKWRKDVAKEQRENPGFFKTGLRWSLDRNYSQRSAIGRYVSILRYDDTFRGGAHPNHVIEAILWDSAAKKQTSIRPFFRETADDGPTLRALAKRIRAALATEKKSRDIPVGDPDTDQQLSWIEPKLLRIGAVVLVASNEPGKSAGFVTYFSPYLVGSYVEGEYHVFIPWRDFSKLLSPAGVALFGGIRAHGDDKND